jgi:hypothetical protein
MSQRTWDRAPSGAVAAQRPGTATTAATSSVAAEAAAGTAAAGAAAAGAAQPSVSGRVRLTGRGALLAMFVLCFLGLLASGWLGWGPLAGGTFVAASALAAARTQRSDLLTVTVSPPALFCAAVICVKALTSSGNMLLSAGTGTLITLANTAPWLLAGTALSLIIAFSRGLRGTAAALGRELHGLPPALARRPDHPHPVGRRIGR